MRGHVMTKIPRLIVFASGTKEGGGSGFEKLVEKKDEGILSAEIVAVVSNHEHGGVRKRAERLKIPFEHIPVKGLKREELLSRYREILAKYPLPCFFGIYGWVCGRQGEASHCSYRYDAICRSREIFLNRNC